MSKQGVRGLGKATRSGHPLQVYLASCENAVYTSSVAGELSVECLKLLRLPLEVCQISKVLVFGDNILSLDELQRLGNITEPLVHLQGCLRAISVGVGGGVSLERD